MNDFLRNHVMVCGVLPNTAAPKQQKEKAAAPKPYSKQLVRAIEKWGIVPQGETEAKLWRAVMAAGKAAAAARFAARAAETCLATAKDEAAAALVKARAEKVTAKTALDEAKADYRAAAAAVSYWTAAQNEGKRLTPRKTAAEKAAAKAARAAARRAKAIERMEAAIAREKERLDKMGLSEDMKKTLLQNFIAFKRSYIDAKYAA